MDSKTLTTLEFPKILERLATYCAFAVSADKARALRPVVDIEEARRLQSETAEALRLQVTHSDLTIGGARDIREPLELARRGGVLEPGNLLDVKYTLIAARNLSRTFERMAGDYPNLANIATQLPPPSGIIDAITRAISERGEVLDTASERLGNIRRDMRVTHERLLSKLQKLVGDSRYSQYLQEALVTQRDGRYVIPLRAEFKGRIQAVVHDQSASGATLFVEPLSVVEMNNEYRELQLAERDEVRRILASLSQQVGQNATDIELTLDVVSDLDLALARGKYAEDLHASEPVFHTIPEKRRKDGHPGTVIRLVEARHPLLDPASVVPVDVELDPETYVLVITGPNTGGKTVTLKTVGLLAVMAQSGLHIPAHSGSEISLFEDIYADIGDEQSIEQSLSTFSSHITNIIRILEQADSHSLVILDELGAGTDPQEGAALARALLLHLLERGITTLVTTHHPELKAFAHAMPGVVNASVEFDLETLRPTFHLTIGLPGRSNALAIAQRLGMPEIIIGEARSELNPQDLHAEDMLDEIHRQRDLAREARAAAEKARQQAERWRLELSERLETIEDERREVLQDAQEQARQEVEALQAELREIRRALARARQPLDAIDVLEEKTEQLERSAKRAVARRSPEVESAVGDQEQDLIRSIRLGDKVRLRTLNSQGVVTALNDDEAEVQMGVLRVRTRLSDLQLVSGGGKSAQEKKAATEPVQDGGAHSEAQPGTRSKASSMELPESPGIEVDLRGLRAEDALDKLERYLERAHLAGLPFVRIIHGKGTGRLRAVVREALAEEPYVRSFEPGSEKEGGDGVTVAKLKTD